MRRATASLAIALLVALPALSFAGALPHAALPSERIRGQLAALPAGVTVPAMTPEVLALADKPAQWQDFLQFNERNLVGHALPEAKVPAPLLPSAGIAAVLAATGTPARIDPLVLAKYDALPLDARNALGSLLAAYVDDLGLAHRAFQGLTVAQRDAFLQDPRAPMPDAWDWALLLGGQRELVAATQAALPVLRAEMPVLAQLPPVSVCSAVAGPGSTLGGINIDFTLTRNLYDCDVAFSIDGQGDDVYLNNAGGSGGQFLPPLGVDLLDHFSLTGVGFALDMGGNDQFLSARAQGGVAGGAFVGQGNLILDGDGTRTYHPAANSSGDFQGGSEEGAGLLLDVGSGNDAYSGDIGLHRKFHNAGGGINGGTVAGSGLMVDFGGNDVYNGTIDGTGGVNGGLHGGSAALLDYGGDDRYDGDVLDFAGVNGAGIGGHGLLLDASGNDVYDGTLETSSGGVNGAAWLGTGRLVDLGGNDDFNGYVKGSGGVNGGSFDPYSYGFLWKDSAAGGFDHFDGRVGEGAGEAGGVNGAAMFGQAQLLHLGDGDALYETHNQDGPIEFANGAAFLSEGLLFQQGGHITWRDSQSAPTWHDVSCYLKGSVAGVLLYAPSPTSQSGCA